MRAHTKKTFLYSCTALAAVSLMAHAQSVWTDVTNAGIYGLNFNVTKNAGGNSAAVLPATPNKLYMIWTERGGSSGTTSQVRVSVYNGDNASPSWKRVDSRVNGAARLASEGINRVPTVAAIQPVLAVFNSTLYAGWVEGKTFQVRLARYNGDDTNPNWTFVDGNAASTGLNRNSGKTARELTMAVFAGKIYLCWAELGGTVKRSEAYQIRVRAYDGINYTWADSGTANGINRDPTRSAGFPSLAAHNGDLFVGFHEWNGSGQQIRVKAYAGGTTWTAVDGGGAIGVNPEGPAIFPSLASLNGQLYIAFDQIDIIRVVSYNGSSWKYADGVSATEGLNKNSAYSGTLPSLTAHNGRLYVAWQEYSHSSSGAIRDTVRMKVFNGDDSAPAWSFTDGGGYSGIAKDSVETTSEPAMASFNGRLYVHWNEGGINHPYQINIAVMDNE